MGRNRLNETREVVITGSVGGKVRSRTRRAGGASEKQSDFYHTL